MVSGINVLEAKYASSLPDNHNGFSIISINWFELLLSLGATSPRLEILWYSLSSNATLHAASQII